MDFLIKKTIEWNDKFEIIIDTEIFSKDLVFITAYNLLDKWYFLFSMDWKNIKVQCKKKETYLYDAEKIIFDFSDELLNVYLRLKIENENKELKNIIIETALRSAIDIGNYIDSSTEERDLDSEINNLLKDLENDPELKIDEEEIKKMINNIKSN